MPGLSFKHDSTDGYRFGFNNQEKDGELGDYYAFEYRMHDARLGRFLSVDPLSRQYPANGPYNFSENKTIAYRELEGLEAVNTLTGQVGPLASGPNVVAADLLINDGVDLQDKNAIMAWGRSHQGYVDMHNFLLNHPLSSITSQSTNAQSWKFQGLPWDWNPLGHWMIYGSSRSGNSGIGGYNSRITGTIDLNSDMMYYMLGTQKTLDFRGSRGLPGSFLDKAEKSKSYLKSIHTKIDKAEDAANVPDAEKNSDNSQNGTTTPPPQGQSNDQPKLTQTTDGGTLSGVSNNTTTKVGSPFGSNPVVKKQSATDYTVERRSYAPQSDGTYYEKQRMKSGIIYKCKIGAHGIVLSEELSDNMDED